MSVLTDRDFRNRHDKDFLILPLEDSCITPLGYDLRVGFALGLPRGEESTSSVSGDKLLLRPQSATLIVCKEHVWLSSKLIGTLHSKGSLAAKGLLVNSTTVDPNWSGRMTFLLHNTSGHVVELGLDAAFITLILHEVQTATESGSSRDPISVAHDYAGIYGEGFGNSLLPLFKDSQQSDDARTFNARVTILKRPSIPKQMSSWVRERIPQLSAVPRYLGLGFNVTAVLMVVIGLFCIAVPDTAEKTLGVTGLRDGKVYFAIFAVVLTLFSRLESSSKRS